MTFKKMFPRWVCEHCQRSFASLSYANRHEIYCNRNPDNQTCSTCVHSVRGADRNMCRVGALGEDDYRKLCPSWKGAL